MKNFFQRVGILTGAVGMMFLAGCATDNPKLEAQHRAEIEARLDQINPPEPLRPMYRALFEQGEHNYVLNAMKLSGVAIRLGYYDDAKRVLDEAVTRIQGISTGKEAAKARSVFHEEAVKPFKGEPYERVMVWFYRGLLYFRDGDYENARACFRSGELEDAKTEGQQYQADWASLDYLGAICSEKTHTDDPQDALKRARQELRGGATLPDTDPTDNLLVAIGVGRGPFKYSTGPYHDQLRFDEHYTPEVTARVLVDGRELATPRPIDDVFYHATTRGGRVVDHILAGKAVFKQTAGTVGNVGLATGAGLAIAGADSRGSTRDDLLIAGAAAAAVGLIAKIAESGAHPEADIRQWDNLPHTIHIVSARLPTGPHRIHIEFLDGHGVQLSGLDRDYNVTIPADNKEQVVIAHSR